MSPFDIKGNNSMQLLVLTLIIIAAATATEDAPADPEAFAVLERSDEQVGIIGPTVIIN